MRLHAFDLGYALHYWRTASGLEVDFVLYGERGLVAFEIKRSDRVRDEDLAGLQAFREDYPMARTFLIHPETRRAHSRVVEILPMAHVLKQLDELLGAAGSPPKLGKGRRQRPAR